MDVLGLPLEMAAVFVATVVAGSIGFVHYVLVSVFGVTPLGSRSVGRPSREGRAK